MILASLSHLKKTIQGSDHTAIYEAVDELDKVTRDLAEKMINQALHEAIKRETVSTDSDKK